MTEGDLVVVLGAGHARAAHRGRPATLDTAPGTLVAVAKHPHQQALAGDLGADAVAEPGEAARLVRRLTGSLAYGNQLTGGADLVLDCVGSEDSIAESLAIVRPRGKVALVGMPGQVKLDLTTLWHRETQLVGAYAYGTETVPSSDDDGAVPTTQPPAHLRPRLRARPGRRPRAPRVRHLPARRLPPRHRARRRRRAPRRREGGLRPPCREGALTMTRTPQCTRRAC